MSCQDTFARLINKASNGVPTMPPSDDHQNGDWLTTDLYEGEFYEDLDTGIVYYRSSIGIETIFDPSIGLDQRFGIGDALIDTDRVIIIDNTTGTLLLDATTAGSPAAPNAGDGIMIVTDDAVAVRGIAVGTGGGVQGLSDTGTAGEFQSGSGPSLVGKASSGAGLFVESQTNAGSIITGRLFMNLFGEGGTIEPSSILHLQSTTLGFKPPQMTTTQRNAISSPSTGLMVDDISTNSYWRFDGTNWIEL